MIIEGPRDLLLRLNPPGTISVEIRLGDEDVVESLSLSRADLAQLEEAIAEAREKMGWSLLSPKLPR
jgi:hypothetical protein